MKKVLSYYLIFFTTWDAMKAAKIYQMIYQNVPAQGTETIEQSKKVSVGSVSNSKPQKSKRDELTESLNYLKSKKVKTKQDKDSIYTLEMVLKNM